MMNTNDIIAALCDERLDATLCRVYGSCLNYHDKKTRITDLAKIAHTPQRTTTRHLQSLRIAGVITTTRHRGQIHILCHPPNLWKSKAELEIAKLTGIHGNTTTTDAVATNTNDLNPTSADTFDAKSVLPAVLQQPYQSDSTHRSFTEELKLLNTHPALNNRISERWIAYLERKYSHQIAAQKTSLLALCDSFVHEFLGKSTGVAVRRLADPATDWERTLQVHVMRAVDHAEFRRRVAILNTTNNANQKNKQQRFKFKSQRRDDGKPPALRGPTSPGDRTSSGATTPRVAALANPHLARIIQQQHSNTKTEP
jgi:DNA-binding transcriptional ArsR family regulator